MVLVTGRTIDQGTTKEHGKLSGAYQDNVAICEIDPDDLKELGVKENQPIKIVSDQGEVVVKAKQSKRGSHPKIVYMPYGLWANMVVGGDTQGTGMPSFKGIAAEIQPAPSESVLTIPQLLKHVFRRDKHAIN